jgi:hypothetical protein
VSFASEIVAAIVTAATRNGIDQTLLAAIVMQESGGNPWATRLEPGFGYLWDVAEGKPYRAPGNVTSVYAPKGFRSPPGVSANTEWICQKSSWGLCQVMGATARWMGFGGHFLSELCEPTQGAEYGARYLATHLAKMEEAEAISSYNAGRPTPDNYDTYVAPVLRLREQFRKEGL